jgi:hypothetical protein
MSGKFNSDCCKFAKAALKEYTAQETFTSRKWMLGSATDHWHRFCRSDSLSARKFVIDGLREGPWFR